jgi:hypothetical protein
MIRLFTSVFPEHVSARKREYDEAFRQNCNCEAIDEMCVYREGGADVQRCARADVRPSVTRPTYADYLSWINEKAKPDDISIIANSDIFFDSQIGVLEKLIPAPNSVLALSRWDTTPLGPALHDHNDSQDAWVFWGQVRPVEAAFPVGVPRCDNRFVSELETAGYRVLNPAFSLRSYHLHSGGRDSYPVTSQPGYVPPPYGYVWPHNMLPLHKTLLHNFRHPARKLGWRIDRRRWSARLKLHWFF